MLRPNELVFNYVVNNYLMGKAPSRFDILAWNADGTNLPAELHRQFLDIFASNLLVTPGAFEVLGTPVDLGRVSVETYVTGATTDHLTPWKGCYRTTQLMSGPSTFVLSNAGHIASLVNPPGNTKAHYFAGPEPGGDAEEWLASSSRQTGTWWRHWAAWVGERSGEERKTPARLGSRRIPCCATRPGPTCMDSGAEVLWAPEAGGDPESGIARFLAWLRAERGLGFDGYGAFWAWSVDQLEDFWQSVWDYYGVSSSSAPGSVLAERTMPRARWVPGGSAELRRARAAPGD